jgi:hypothetical protein
MYVVVYCDEILKTQLFMDGGELSLDLWFVVVKPVDNLTLYIDQVEITARRK